MGSALRNDIDRGETLCAVLDFELDELSFDESFEAVDLNLGVMDEDLQIHHRSVLGQEKVRSSNQPQNLPIVSHTATTETKASSEE